MKTAKIGYIAISAVFVVLGILLIAIPDFSASAIGIICGAILIAFGAIRLVGYFSRDLYRLAFQYDLAFGILLIALGIIMILNPRSLMNFICITLGLSFFADGLFKVQIALDSKKFGIDEWWLILALAVITAAFGVILVICPDESSRVLTVLLGISMMGEGVLNISTMITAVKIIKNQKPDIIEIDTYEERED